MGCNGSKSSETAASLQAEAGTAVLTDSSKDTSGHGYDEGSRDSGDDNIERRRSAAADKENIVEPEERGIVVEGEKQAIDNDVPSENEVAIKARRISPPLDEMSWSTSTEIAVSAQIEVHKSSNGLEKIQVQQATSATMAAVAAVGAVAEKKTGGGRGSNDGDAVSLTTVPAGSTPASSSSAPATESTLASTLKASTLKSMASPPTAPSELSTSSASASMSSLLSTSLSLDYGSVSESVSESFGGLGSVGDQVSAHLSFSVLGGGGGSGDSQEAGGSGGGMSSSMLASLTPSVSLPYSFFGGSGGSGSGGAGSINGGDDGGGNGSSSSSSSGGKSGKDKGVSKSSSSGGLSGGSDFVSGGGAFELPGSINEEGPTQSSWEVKVRRSTDRTGGSWEGNASSTSPSSSPSFSSTNTKHPRSSSTSSQDFEKANMKVRTSSNFLVASFEEEEGEGHE